VTYKICARAANVCALRLVILVYDGFVRENFERI